MIGATEIGSTVRGQARPDLRARLVAAGYARVWAALATFSLLITFVPLHHRWDPSYHAWPDLWGLNWHASPVVLGGVLVIGEIVVLTYGALCAPRSPGLPISVSVIAGIEFVILVSRVGVPASVTFSAAGVAAVIVAGITAPVGVIAAVHLTRIARTAGQGSRSVAIRNEPSM